MCPNLHLPRTYGGSRVQIKPRRRETPLLIVPYLLSNNGLTQYTHAFPKQKNVTVQTPCLELTWAPMGRHSSVNMIAPGRPPPPGWNHTPKLRNITLCRPHAAPRHVNWLNVCTIHGHSKLRVMDLGLGNIWILNVEELGCRMIRVAHKPSRTKNENNEQHHSVHSILVRHYHVCLALSCRFDTK